MSTEPITGLTYQDANSLQTDALQNAELNYFGAWLNCAVLTIGDAAPPGSPTNGDRYIVGTGTGAWATHDDELAVYRDGWQFYAPKEGDSCVNLDDGFRYVFLSGAWATASVSVSVTAADVAPAVVSEATSARTIDPATDAGKYIRYTGTGAKTCTFDDGDGFASGEEYHVANRGASGDVTLTPGGTMTLNAPAGGSLVVEPGMTVTVKMVATDEADVMGQTA